MAVLLRGGVGGLSRGERTNPFRMTPAPMAQAAANEFERVPTR
jgi:hypothetical protein